MRPKKDSDPALVAVVGVGIGTGQGNDPDILADRRGKRRRGREFRAGSDGDDQQRERAPDRHADDRNGCCETRTQKWMHRRHSEFESVALPSLTIQDTP